MKEITLTLTDDKALRLVTILNEYRRRQRDRLALASTQHTKDGLRNDIALCIDIATELVRRLDKL